MIDNHFPKINFQIEINNNNFLFFLNKEQTYKPFLTNKNKNVYGAACVFVRVRTCNLRLNKQKTILKIIMTYVYSFFTNVKIIFAFPESTKKFSNLFFFFLLFVVCFNFTMNIFFLNVVVKRFFSKKKKHFLAF